MQKTHSRKYSGISTKYYRAQILLLVLYSKYKKHTFTNNKIIVRIIIQLHFLASAKKVKTFIFIIG